MSLFLCLQGNTYHYRKAIPATLRPYLGKWEIKQTLRTGNKLEAKRKASLFNEKINKTILAARKVMGESSLSELEKKKIVSGYFHFILRTYDLHLEDDYEDYPCLRAAVEMFGEDPEPYIYNERVNQEKESFEIALSNHRKKDYKVVKFVAKCSSKLFAQDLDENKLTPPLLFDLSLAGVDARRLIYARSQGENPPIPDQYKDFDPSKNIGNPDSIPTTPSVQFKPQNPQLKTKESEGYPLSKIIEDYTIDRRSAGKWNEKTKSENLACYNNFLEFTGENIFCADIDYHLVRDYREALTKLPANRNKSKKFRGKSIREILKMRVDNPMSTTTVNKNLNRLSSLFKFAIKLEKMNVNPAEGLELSVATKDSELRAVYSNDELQRLFNSDEYLNDSFKKPFMFWVIPIALFTGMRQTEIAQLHLHDIKKEGDIWYIDINDDTKTKKLKNKNARRKVPLHDFLSKTLNLSAYAEKLKSEGHKRLFPELNYGRDGYGQTVSRWYNDTKRGYKIRYGIKSTQISKKDFHSFRHTAIDHLKQKQVDVELLHEFDGHSFGTMTMDRYGKAYHLKTVYGKIVSQISFDQELDLKHLMKSKYVLM